ncbi:uncharacterized protein LOC118457507 [Anopheles albimanus]|uniref:CTCK domain-containing protein n=1 Tax=Anopheles albimanus TaxID=7167 RepID=A0A182F1K9_ANOAL|nr:uncharacterized protein LOC118457507 [Anopheles albimanus]
MSPTVRMLALLVCLLVHSSGHRIKLSDSILDIINTRHVEQILAERRANASREHERQRGYLVQNDLDEDVTEDSSDSHLYQTPEVAIDFDFNGRRQGHGHHHGHHQVPLAYNTSEEVGPLQQQQPPGSDLLSDMHAYRGDKLLKSSKNALLVTRKEYLKKDWCKTEPLVQRIREEGCLSRTIVNRFCYGQCNSFYIPKSPKRHPRRPGGGGGHGAKQHNGGGGGGGGGYSATASAAGPVGRNRDVDLDFEDEDLTGPAFRSCAFCKPKKFTWITVTLRCPSLVPQLRRKRIQRIKQCKCIAEPLH